MVLILFQHVDGSIFPVLSNRFPLSTRGFRRRFLMVRTPVKRLIDKVYIIDNLYVSYLSTPPEAVTGLRLSLGTVGELSPRYDEYAHQ